MQNSDQDLKVGQVINGFEITRITTLADFRGTAVELTHQKSGARVLHVKTDDTENCMAVTFPTPASDDTGVAHILEHAVLGGSRKFPVREPFFEMVKMSMATFINAMTAQAFTYYPVATNVKKDFFNLADVYLDAVFFPQIKRGTFLREGHHLTLEDNADPTSELKISGIVYNEMKGYYSRPESLMWNLAGRGLYEGSPLGFDSGGDPDFIPDLTYQNFKAFHEKFYHPSNAQIYLYGDISLQEKLAMLGPVLSEFDKKSQPDIAPKRCPKWTAPKTVERTYPVGQTDDTKARTFIVMNWAVGDAMDPRAQMDWSVLSTVLLGNEAAPLKKAIIDAKLGADIFFAGSHANAWEMSFHVGIKGSEPDRAAAFEKLVTETLSQIAANPIDPTRVSSAFQQLSYTQLEVSTLFPMKLLGAVNMAWPYGHDPLTFANLSDTFKQAQKRYEADPELYNKLIRQSLLNNTHKLTVTLKPEPGAQVKIDEAFKAKMAARKTALGEDEISLIAAQADALAKAQSVPNTPEQLATLPQLKTSDLPKTPRNIPTKVSNIAGITLLHNEVFANGVNYLEMEIDLAGLPLSLYESLPRYIEAVNKMGAAGQGYEKIAERRVASTGGVGAGTSVTRHRTKADTLLRRVRFGLKTLDGQADTALDLLADLIFKVDPTDKARMADILNQTRASARTGLISDGRGTAIRAASRAFGPGPAIDHLLASPDALRRLETLIANFDSRFDGIVSDVTRIRDFLQNPARWTVSFTGSATVLKLLEKKLAQWSAMMKAGPIVDVPFVFEASSGLIREGLAGPMKVAHCAKVMPGPKFNDPRLAAFGLGIYLATFDHFLPEIRFKGNAYGAGGGYNDGSGLLTLSSYFDPRIVETLDCFDGLKKFVSAATWTQTDIDRAIIGSAKSAEKPIRPGEATSASLSRHTRGDTDELRAEYYQSMLRSTPGDVITSVLDTLDENEPIAAVCVVSSREKLEEANKRLAGTGRALSVSDILG